jgi:GT2 family glycosyltransferase
MVPNSYYNSIFVRIKAYVLIDISIIIVNYRGWKYLNDCLEALDSFQNEPFNYEVIIVDNCSNDGQLEQFQSKFRAFHFVLNSGNNGFSNGCNLGASLAKGTYLLFLNPDILATGSAINGLLQTIQDQPQITILSCKQINMKEREERLYRFFPSVFTVSGIVRSLYRKLKKRSISGHLTAESGVIYPDWVSGSLVLMSKYNFEKIGRWSENYWLYYEDVDLCRRTVFAGGKIAVNTNICVIHNHGGTTRTNLHTSALTKSEVIISLHVFLSSNYSLFKAFSLHAMVIFDTLVVKLVPALLGLPFFFIKRLKQYSLIYKRMLIYYSRVLMTGNWLSNRSMNYRR